MNKMNSVNKKNMNEPLYWSKYVRFSNKSLISITSHFKKIHIYNLYLYNFTQLLVLIEFLKHFFLEIYNYFFVKYLLELLFFLSFFYTIKNKYPHYHHNINKFYIHYCIMTIWTLQRIGEDAYSQFPVTVRFKSLGIATNASHLKVIDIPEENDCFLKDKVYTVKLNNYDEMDTGKTITITPEDGGDSINVIVIWKYNSVVIDVELAAGGREVIAPIKRYGGKKSRRKRIQKKRRKSKRR